MKVNINIIIGDFEKGKQEGYGVYMWPDNRKYEGQFVNGKQHGEGLFTSKDGKQRKGIWEDGKRIKWLDEI